MSWSEMDGWPKESLVHDDFTPERKLIGPWSERLTKMASLEETEYPYIPGCGAYPSFIGTEPFSAQDGTPSEVANYDTCVITVKYTSKLNTNGVIMEWTDPMTHTIRVPQMDVYNSEGKRVEQGYLHQSGLVLHHVRKKLALVPDIVFDTVDGVNAGVISTVILMRSFAKETLFVSAPHIDRTWTVSGMTSFNVHQQFVYRSNGGLGWNAIFNPKTASFGYLYANNSRIYNYPLVNPLLI